MQFNIINFLYIHLDIFYIYVSIFLIHYFYLLKTMVIYYIHSTPCFFHLIYFEDHSPSEYKELHFFLHLIRNGWYGYTTIYSINILLIHVYFQFFWYYIQCTCNFTQVYIYLEAKFLANRFLAKKSIISIDRYNKITFMRLYIFILPTRVIGFGFFNLPFQPFK